MIIEGHDVEKATEMVDAMQPSRVGAAYLALTAQGNQISSSRSIGFNSYEQQL